MFNESDANVSELNFADIINNGSMLKLTVC